MLPYPNLDDRRFADLVAEAREVIGQRCPEWTDRSANDPGMVLVEVVAHLTEILLFRLNQVPDKVHVALLNLLGATLDPPSPARVTLELSVDEPATQPVHVPLHTQVTVVGGGPGAPVFRTLRDAEIPPGETSVRVDAADAEPVEAELLGSGDGRPGQSFRVARAPVVAAPLRPDEPPSAPTPRLLVGVEVDAGDDTGELQVDGRSFALWNEAVHRHLTGEPRTFLADLATGIVQFGSGVGDDQVPGAGRQVRAWYWTGGGPSGNVDAGTLTSLVRPIQGLRVVNPSAALGGRPTETLASARERGAALVHSPDVCVTPRDYERAACRHGAIARARAITSAAVWRFAPAGQVEVVLVPAVEGDRAVDTHVLAQHRDDAVRAEVEATLRERQPLGSTTEVAWANVRTVSARVSLSVRPEEDSTAVRQRVLDRLYGTITPLRTRYSREGWPFGRDLYASDVYDIALAEPAVSHVRKVRLVVDNVPGRRVRSISRDWYQDRTWFVAADDAVYRTRDDGSSWEALRVFEGEEVTCVAAHPGRDVDRGGPARPGLVALVRSAESAEGRRATVMVSRDLGESWTTVVGASYPILDVAWLETGAQPALLVATERGLFRTGIEPSVPAVPMVVDEDHPELGIFSVTAYRRANGATEVAVATMGGGVRGSSAGGEPGSFERWPLGQDTRVVESEYRDNGTFLWVGAIDGAREVAPFRMNRDDASPSFVQLSDGWTGEGCTAIASAGGEVVAGSYSSGALRLGRTDAGEVWERPGIDSGLPIRDEEGFLLEPVSALAMRPGMVMAGSATGVFRSEDARRYVATATEEFTDEVSLPDGWLFCSGDHDVEVS